MLSAYIQPNAVTLIWWHFAVQMDIDQTRTAKAIQEFLKAKKWDILQWPNHLPDLNPTEHAFELFNRVEVQQSISRDETLYL